MKTLIVDDRWHAIADKIRSVDSTLTIGQKICEVGIEVLSASSVSLALVVEHAYSAIASSSDVSMLLDEEQFGLGDGPTFDAQGSRHERQTND